MKMINKSKVLLIALSLLIMVMSSVSAEEAPSMYFVPADGTGICGETTTVDLMLNHSIVITGVQAQVDFDPTCINITDVDYTGCPWQPLVQPGWGHYGNYIRLASLDTSGVFPPGPHKIATLSIECVSGSNCTSAMELTDTMPVGHIPYNTMFTCNVTTEPDPDPVAEISIGDGSGVDTIPIVVTNADNVGAIDVTLSYSTSVVNITGVTDGDMEVTVPNLENVGDGWIRVGAFQVNDTGLSGDFTLLYVDFEPVGSVSSCPLTISVTTFKDATPDTNTMNYTIGNGVYSSSLNGDVNNDDKVDVADVMYIARHVVGIAGFETIDEDAADVNGDGIIDIADAMYLAKHIVGISGFEELR